jgi:D-tyrosyl-tRNA(Tyr) deacylase
LRALIQRVGWVRVEVNAREVSSTGKGLLIFLGIAADDGESEAAYLSGRASSLRIFEDSEGKMNLSLAECGGEAMVVSQFTLLADTRKGNRPGFSSAAPPGEAEHLYNLFVKFLRQKGIPVSTGVFGADMKVSLCNDGPVTILLESK